MTAMKPITNLAEPLTQSGGNGAAFEFRYRRLGAAIGLEKLWHMTRRVDSTDYFDGE